MGTMGFQGKGRPVVPLSWDKKKNLVLGSLCPGTMARANCALSRPVGNPTMGVLKLKKLVNVVHGWSQRKENQFLNACMAPNVVKTPSQSIVKTQ